MNMHLTVKERPFSALQQPKGCWMAVGRDGVVKVDALSAGVFGEIHSLKS